MNILTRLKAISSMIFSTNREWHWLLPRTSYNYSKDVGDGLRSSVLVAVLFWIMRRFAEAKMVIEINEEVEREHELLDLLHRPNSFYSGRLMRMAMSLSYNVDGNAYAIKIRNSQRKPVELWYVPHWMMEPHWPASGTEYIDYYNYTPQGIPIRIDPEDVVHIRFGLDPNNTRKGLAPLKSLVREIFTDDEAANFTATLLRNFGIPGLIISPDSDDAMPDKDAPQTIKDFFRAKIGDERGEPLVMSSKTHVEQFGFNPKELDLSKLREIPEERVCATLGVHAAVVGLGTGMQQTKVGGTMKELRESAYEDCIIPMQNTFAEELDIQLLNEFEPDTKNIHVSFDLSDIRVLQEDENKHAERIVELTEASLITIAEGRAELGYEVKPEHEAYLRRFNMLVIPAASLLSPVLSNNNGGNSNNGNGSSEEDEKLSTAQFKVNSFKVIVPFGIVKAEAWQLALVQAFYRDWLRMSAIWSKELVQEFKKLGKNARKVWEKIVEERGVELFARFAQTKMSLDELYADLVVEQMDCKSYLDFKVPYIRVATQTFETIDTVLGLGVNMTDPIQAVVASTGGTRRGLIDLTKQTKDAVFKAIAEARLIGEGPYAAAIKIEKLVEAGPWSTSEIRADVIGRTETKYAQNMSTLEAYKAAEFSKVQIVDGQIENSCEPCIARDGEIMDIDAAYSLDEHPNGTLSWSPVLER